MWIEYLSAYDVIYPSTNLWGHPLINIIHPFTNPFIHRDRPTHSFPPKIHSSIHNLINRNLPIYIFLTQSIDPLIIPSIFSSRCCFHLLYLPISPSILPFKASPIHSLIPVIYLLSLSNYLFFNPFLHFFNLVGPPPQFSANFIHPSIFVTIFSSFLV